MQGGKQGTAFAPWWTLGVLFLGIFLLIVFGMFQVLAPENDHLTSEAEGYVSRVEKKESSRKGTVRYTYITYVTFTDSDQQTFTARSVVNGANKRHDEGDLVTVHYDPRDPEAGCLIVGDEDRLFMFNALRYFCGIGGAVLIGVFALLLIYFKFVREPSERQ